jgi:branched-chain amino acid transport system permease protein
VSETVAQPIAQAEEPVAPTSAERPGPWRPSPAGMIARGVVLAGLVAFVLATPPMMPGVTTNILSTVAIYVVVALSLNILIGYTGQISLGHGAFLGAGGFAAGIAITNLNMPWAFAQVVAVLVGGLFALALGLVALRVKGLYLALVTLAYGLFAQEVLFGLGWVSRGGAGMPADRPEWAMGDVAYAYVCIAAVALVWALDWRLTSSRAGRAIQALRDSENVASSWGINVTAYKLLAFVLSGMVAGLAGGLFASVEELVSTQTFTLELSLMFLFMAVLGGAGSRPGVVLAAVLLGFLEFGLDQMSAAFSWAIDGSAAPMFSALLVLLVLLFVPGGVAQMLGGVFRWLSFRPFRDSRGGDESPAAIGGGDGGRP